MTLRKFLFATIFASAVSMTSGTAQNADLDKANELKKEVAERSAMFEICDAINSETIDDKARALYEFAVKIEESNPGMFNPIIADKLNNLAATGHAPSQAYLDYN